MANESCNNFQQQQQQQQPSTTAQKCVKMSAEILYTHTHTQTQSGYKETFFQEVIE